MQIWSYQCKKAAFITVKINNSELILLEKNKENGKWDCFPNKCFKGLLKFVVLHDTDTKVATLLLKRIMHHKKEGTGFEIS